MVKEHCKFSYQTRQEALKQADYRCQICGEKCNYLEVHHIIAIWFAIHYCPSLSTEVIRDISNAIAVCPNCHAQLHKDESVDIYKCLAVKLWGIEKFSDSHYGEGRLERVYGK